MNTLDLLVTTLWNRLWRSQEKIDFFGWLLETTHWGARNPGLENGLDTREPTRANQQGQINSHDHSYPSLGFSGWGECPVEWVCANAHLLSAQSMDKLDEVHPTCQLVGLGAGTNSHQDCIHWEKQFPERKLRCYQKGNEMCLPPKKKKKWQVSAMNETLQKKRLCDFKINLILDGLITSKLTCDI